MKIIVAKNAGFCYGVKRAVEGAKQVIKENREKVYCLGELVHNQDVIDKLKKEGMIFVNEIEETRGKTIIRAHGASKDVYDIAKQKQIPLVDFTCPNVLKIHEIVKEYVQKDFFIMIIGNAKHPEMIATESYSGEYFYVIEKQEDVEKAMDDYKKSRKKSILVVSQTTYSTRVFEECVNKIINQCPKEDYLEVKNTICKTTETRQKEAFELSKIVDKMIVIGGNQSSNTQKLYDICKKNCDHTLMVQNAEELVELFSDIDVVGVVAGASTPQESIDSVVKRIEKMKKKTEELL